MKKRQSKGKRTWAIVCREVRSQLSPKQLDLLRSVAGAEQPSYQRAADVMHVKLSTFHTHRRKLFKRWDITSKVGLVLFAYRYGIAKPC